MLILGALSNTFQELFMHINIVEFWMLEALLRFLVDIQFASIDLCEAVVEHWFLVFSLFLVCCFQFVK